MYNAHWIHSLPYSKFIELTLFRSNRGEMFFKILKRVSSGVCFMLANGETPRSFSSFASLFSCLFAFASIELLVVQLSFAISQSQLLVFLIRPFSLALDKAVNQTA